MVVDIDTLEDEVSNYDKDIVTAFDINSEENIVLCGH